ncbi:feruloyl-CoA synthase [Phreatobacter sp.]|uniref:feruloyl-CoA synthase n=1 Tax=Phreatobacter sp. TaxID=1966341 RepID=UPI003F7304AD
MNAHAPQPLRPIRFQRPDVTVERRDDGVVLVRPQAPLAPYPDRLTDRLLHWAAISPERIFIAERAGGGWREITYRQALASARSIAAGLLARGLSAERPLAILSGNSIDHALLALGALHAGVPFCAVSPAYSTVSRDFGKLRYVMALLTPGLVHVDEASVFAPAIAAAVPPDVEVMASRGDLPGRRVTALADLLATTPTADVDQAHAAIGPQTIAKFLLTSGSTGMPKAVINTQRMLCSNQVMLRETLAFLKEEPPVIVDWLPWNHTFGGNHNVGLVLYNGGTLHIDDGRPVPGGIEATVRNLREIAPTVYFNVPKGYEELVRHLHDDAGLRRHFFSRLNCLFFAGASLATHVWRALDEASVMETGQRLPMLTGLGATETAPFSMSVTPETSRSGHVGLPVAGNEIKLVPSGGKLEVRVRGPNVTPGYWRQPDVTARAFDEEGYYCFGDALRPVDPGDLSRGFDFDGRISEDFKLATGTWVSVGPLRARFIAATAPLVRDVVIAGLDRDQLAAIVILDQDGVRQVLPHLAGADLRSMAADPALRGLFRQRLTAFAATATGSASRIARAVLLDEAPSIDAGEITDKGSINQRAVLQHRAALVELLYARPVSPAVMEADAPAAAGAPVLQAG